MATATEEKKIGHAAHTKDSQMQDGLKGKILRPLNITFLGAGSGFCPTLCRDILMIPGADRGELRLVDIDPERLGMMHKVITRLVREAGKEAGWTVRSSTNRKEVLPGTTHAVCCVEVSGTACVTFDNDIPLKYGIDQCIGDTIGPGGLFKSLRTIPVFLDILRDMRELCPGAPMLNYTNPMSMMCLAAGRAVPEVPVVGLCHSVQGTSELVAKYAGVPLDEVEWECAGINHLAWFTKFRHAGKDLYSTVLFEKFKRELAEGIAEAKAGLAIHDAKNINWSDTNEPEPYKQNDLIRKDMCVQFGAFITESSGHLSEYLPYYRKSDAGRALLRRNYHGGSRFYATNWPTWRKGADAQRARLVSGEEGFTFKRSWEYGSWIIEAMEKDSPIRIHGNVMNHARGERGAGQLITNLPADGCVEVACMIDRNGIHPTRYGALPAQMAGICEMNMRSFDLGAKACVEKSKEAAIHSLMLDPLTSAICTPAQVREMTVEMFDAEKDFLPGYR